MQNTMYDQFGTDGNAEKTGIWINYSEQFRIRVARAGGANKKFQKRLEALTAPWRRAIATENMDPELIKKIMREAYADAIILGWETMVDGQMVSGILPKPVKDAAPVEITEEMLLPVNKVNITETFENLPDLFEDLQDQARNMTIFRSALREEAAKNS